ncbi:fatty acid synthase-like [Bemisia tabaci]|uniref:fatty acid synthase-like n=1 Tax=Bemisia tabaci TaxID=7038 RepID=UPI003B2888D5
MGSQWPGMGLQLLHVPVFRAAIERCDRVLKPRGIDIFEVLTSKDEAINDNIVHSFVAITSIQIGLTEVLRALKLEPSGVIGHSVGELGCAYADNCLTIEQTILSAYARGKAVMESTLIEGTMAAVGLGYHDIRDSVPKSIDIGCRNSSTSCTISGPAADVEAYVSKLTSEGVFAKNVSASGIAYHSRYLEPAAPLILKYLREVIKLPRKRSSKWLSTSVPQEEWHKDKAIYCSPEYHLNNMMSPVLFEDVLKRIPSNAVVIEIAPHGLLQAILKREIPDRAHVPLTKRSTTGDGARFLLDAIGQ